MHCPFLIIAATFDGDKRLCLECFNDLISGEQDFSETTCCNLSWRRPPLHILLVILLAQDGVCMVLYHQNKLSPKQKKSLLFSSSAEDMPHKNWHQVVTLHLIGKVRMRQQRNRTVWRSTSIPVFIALWANIMPARWLHWLILDLFSQTGFTGVGAAAHFALKLTSNTWHIIDLPNERGAGSKTSC